MSPPSSSVLALTGWILLAAAPARAAEEGPSPLRCASCCATGLAEPRAEPRLSRGQAKLLGGVAGLGLGVVLGRKGSPVAGPLALTPVRSADALVMGSALALVLSPKLLKHDEPFRLAATPDCAGVAAGPNAFDRKLRELALGDRSLEKRELLSRVSWATLTAALAQPVALTLSGDAPHKGRDLAVWGEAAAVSIAVDQAVKHLVHRTRPSAHFCEPQRESDLCAPDARLSFYSGHTSAAFVAAVAAGTIADFHGLANRKWVWASGLTLATATGVLRVAADKHYATDVLAGAAAGTLAGWLIPKLHRPETAHPSATAARARPGPALAIPVALRTRGATTLVSAGFADGGPSLQVQWQW